MCNRLFAVLAFLLLVSPVFAAPGKLDATFGGGKGWVNGGNPYSLTNDYANSVIQQADGKLVAAGAISNGSDNDFGLLRYNQNGTRDSSFGNQGKLILDLGHNDEINSVIQQADGKLVVAGISSNTSNDDFVLVRYNLDGTLDTTFDGDGKVFTDFGYADKAKSVIQQADGKLVVAGTSTSGDGSSTDFALARYNEDGTLDASFGNAGKLTTHFNNNTEATSIIQQADGKLAVAGNSLNASSYYDFALARYNEDGTLDTSFAGSGKLTTDFDGYEDKCSQLIQQADGKLLLVGHSYYGIAGSGYKFALARYNADGTPDTGFDGDGKLTTRVGDGLDLGTAIVQTADEKLIVAGASWQPRYRFALVRYNLDGSLDASFNNDGMLVVIIKGLEDFAHSMVVQSDGKLVVAGYGFDLATNNRDLVVARFLTIDDDNDGIENNEDNCPSVANVNQLDSDGDGVGNACDGTPNGDTDNDGIDNAADNCIAVSNFSQTDTDTDGVGDACDATPNGDTDNDGIDNTVDNCVAVSNFSQTDTDTDGVGDACDATPNGDTDNDGIDNVVDNCVAVSNASQIDTDNDGAGNACDTDDDGDGVADLTDNCPHVANTDQLNNDGDAQGDICDTDDDNDGVIDTADAFSLNDEESEDTDGDNIGDNSDPIIDDANTLNNVFGEIKTDKAGSSVAFAGDFNGDGYGDYVIGIPGYDVPATEDSKIIKDAGRAVVISGKNGDELASVDGWMAKSAMGSAVAGGADYNGDGYIDVIIGSPKADKSTGVVQILFGPDGVARYGIGGSKVGDLFGSSVALGDVNGDGLAEAIIGAPKADDLHNPPKKVIDAGSVLVTSYHSLTFTNQFFYGAKAKAYAGTAVAAGDVDNDGNADIIIGAPNDDDVDHKLSDAGSVAAYNIDGDELLKEYGGVAKAYLGKSVAAGDVNDDGVADVLAGATGDDTPATLDTKKITDTGSVTVFSGADAAIITKQYGATAKAGLGNSVAAGDVDDDGFADIIAGAKLDDKPGTKIIKDTGSVSVWSGDGYAQISSTLYGSVSKDYFGTSVSSGDVNGDGKADLIIGIPGFDIPATPTTKIIKDAGAVKVQSGASLLVF